MINWKYKKFYNINVLKLIWILYTKYLNIELQPQHNYSDNFNQMYELQKKTNSIVNFNFLDNNNFLCLKINGIIDTFIQIKKYNK